MINVAVQVRSRTVSLAWMRSALASFVVAALAVCGIRPSAAAPRPPVWQVYALRYATIRAFPVRDLVTGADTTRTIDIAMMVWLLEGPDRRKVLVDAGFYRQKFLDEWKPADYVRPSEVAQRLGVSRDSITDVIISHVHWDHLDGADLFPNARIWIQREEYEHYVNAEGNPLAAAIDTLDAAMLAALKAAGRVSLVNGDAQGILPGIVAYTGGKHTFQSQYVGVHTAKGTVVVASDNLYLYENLEKHAPIAQTLDAKSNLAAQERMKKLASSPRLIVPGHDPAVFSRYTRVGSGVVKVE
jgi:glyoxylase-like metal-dependent hydrolase (beta-lactamase superfamily II)